MTALWWFIWLFFLCLWCLLMKFRNEEEKNNGTTCLTFICKEGIVMAADGLRSKLRQTGYEVLEEDRVKVFLLGKYVTATYSGNTEVEKRLKDHLINETKKRDLEKRQRLTAEEYARCAENFLVKEELPDINAVIMFAAYDGGKKEKRHPSVFIVGKGGCCLVPRYECIGSGRIHALHILNGFHRHVMTIPEMISLAKQALVNSAKVNGSTGGFTNIALLTPNGKVKFERRVHLQDVAKEYDFDIICKKKGR